MDSLRLAMLGSVILLIGTTWTGWSILSLLRIASFRVRSPEVLCLSAFVGATSWTLLIGWLSYLGLPVRSGMIIWLFFTLSMSGLAYFTRSRVSGMFVHPLGAWLLGACFCGLALGICWLGLIRCGQFDLIGDPITYCITSERLQNHGFHEPCDQEFHTLDGEFLVWQTSGSRMGANFLFALCQACIPGVRAIDLFPAMTAFGTLLNLFGVYLAIRWGLRLSRFYGSLGILACGLLANPMTYSANAGFMNQLYGTAFLGCCLAVLSRGLAPSNHHWRMALLIGLLHAGLFVFYSEMMPLLLGADLVFAVRTLISARDRGGMRAVLLFGLLIGAFGLAFANYDLVRAGKMLSQWGSIVVGWPIPFDVAGYTAFALGGAHYRSLQFYESLFALPVVDHVVTLVLVGMVVLGILSLCWHTRRNVLLGSCLVLGLLILRFATIDDPITGLPGHRWSLFKLCKYGYPLVLLLQIQGIWFVCREFRLLKWLTCGLLLALVHHHFPNHRVLVREQFVNLSRILHSPAPLQEMRELRRLIQRERPDHVLLGSAEPLTSTLLALAIHPTPIVNRWVPGHRSFLHTLSILDHVPEGKCLLIDSPMGSSTLPFRSIWIDRNSPTILRIHSRNASLAGQKDFIFPITDQAVAMEVFSPLEASATLTFHVQGSSADRTSTKKSFRLIQANGERRDCSVALGAQARAEIPVRLPKGVSKLTIECLDSPSIPSSAHDAELVQTHVVNPRLTLTATANSGR